MGRDIFVLLGGLAVIALIFGGYRLWRHQGDVSKGRLMIIAALVLLTNLLIIGLPAGG
jgi:hypothetical protein